MEKIALAGLLHDLASFLPQPIPVPEPFRPDENLTPIINLADRLLAGQSIDPERKIEQLRSIFSQVSLASPQTPPLSYIPPFAAQVANWKQVKPTAAPLDDEPLRAAYQTLWENFADEAAQLSDETQESIAAYLEGIYYLMARYIAAIPAGRYYAEADVSLFDHRRLAAALACCLSECKAADTLADSDTPWTDDTEIAVLIGVDISGVQDFIYTITSDHAAQTLRGRSFYLQLLTEAILRFVLAELSLPITSVIYSGGAHFFLLAPLSARDKLPAIHQTITEKLLASHGIDLYTALGWATVKASDFAPGAMPACWDEMHRALATAKQTRYQELGEDVYDQVFKLRGQGGSAENTCTICHAEWPFKLKPENSDLPDDDPNQTRIGPVCRSFQEDLGQHLPRAEYILLGIGKPDSEVENDGRLAALRAFGLQVALLGPGGLPNMDQLADADYHYNVTFISRQGG